MGRRAKLWTRFTLLGVVAAIGSGEWPRAAFAGANDFFVIKAPNLANEQYERDVDEVALASQDKAISKLQGLLKKYQGTHQEPILLSKLAELQHQTGAIHFRIAHGRASVSKKPMDLSRFNKAMGQTIKTLSTLIAKYPHFNEVAHAYFLRGKAYEETNNKALATKDYLKLVNDFPEWDEVSPAYMSLAEFSIEDNNHAQAIVYLKEIEKKPEDPHFPFALYKLAWAYYNLKDTKAALSYAERQIAYYSAKGQKDDGGNLVTSDNALRENTLLDTAVFYFQGYEEKTAEYPLADALPYFKKLDSGPILGRVMLRFAKLLRSHSHEADMMAYKDYVLLTESDRPESLEVLLTTYELQLNKRRFEQLVDSAHDMVKLHAKHPKHEGFGRAQKMLLDTADGLQTVIVKNKDASEVSSLSVVLATIYDSFTRIVDESDPRIPRVHYNLAETLFTIKDYIGATTHYRWVVDHGKWGDKDPKSVSVTDSALKAISSRYEVLRQKQLIPKELLAKAIQANTTEPLDPMLSQWIDWIDTYAGHTYKDLDSFMFESNRALYARNHIERAIDRLKRFAVKFPKSPNAIPSASLVIDTFIASSEWEKTYDLAHDFIDIDEWKSSEFGKRLHVVAADASYKLVEAKYAAKDYKATLKAADKFLEKFAKSARVGDCLDLAGRTALQTGEKQKAVQYFTRLITELPKSDHLSAALLARATVSEERYQFSTASADYKAYLSLPSKTIKIDESQADSLRKKILILSWLSGDSTELRTTLDNKSICNDNLSTQCEKYVALMTLSSDGRASDESVTEDAFDKARKGASENKALWAAVALEGSKHLAFRDRNLMLRVLAGGWEDLDALTKFSLLPTISVSIPKAFQLNRMSMRDVAPLRADERYITRRVEVIREMENAATKIMKMPWARVRAQALNEIAGLYIDLARGLQSLPPPKGMTPAELPIYEDTIRKLILPFEEKGQDLRMKSFEIASQFAIEDEAFKNIADPFFAENPSYAKRLKPNSQLPPPPKVNLELLAELDPSGKWNDVKGKSYDADDAALRLKANWVSAVQAKRWSQIAFFMQEAKEKKQIQGPALGLVRAVSLTQAGARGEGLLEIEDARKTLEPELRNVATTTLIQYSLQACSREKTQSWLKEIQADKLSKNQTKVVELATGYVNPAPAAQPKVIKVKQ